MAEIDLAEAAQAALVPDEYAVGVVEADDGGRAIVVHFAGHRAGSGHAERVTVAMAPSGAADLFRNVAAALQTLAPQRDSFGRPE